MTRTARLGALLLVGACGHAPANPDAARAHASSVVVPAGLEQLHAAARVPGLELRTFTQAELWAAIAPIVEGARHLRVAEVGRSAEGRPLRSVTFGSGPTRVLMWSQMHGDESTASMALADIYAFVERSPDHPVARTILDNLTVTTIPMLNPDGAQRFQRRNAYGIDVNRDARMLATPEGRTLKTVFDRVEPDFAFNLHDQDVGTRLGDGDDHVAIALLAPAFDESRAVNDVRRRAMRVASVFRQAIEPLVGGHIARYDDTFNPRAFGDLTTTWGASAVLVESGAWPGDPEKQHLRKANFVGLVAALHAIADRSYADADDRLYTGLPENGRSLPDLLVTGGSLALPGLEPVRADLLVEYRNGARRTDGYVSDIGDLGGRQALDTLDLTGLYVVPAAAMLERSHGPHLQQGAPAIFHVARTPEGPALWRFDGALPSDR